MERPQVVEVPLYFQEAQVGTIQMKVSTVLSQDEVREMRDWIFHPHLTALFAAVVLSGGTFFLIARAVSHIRSEVKNNVQYTVSNQENPRPGKGDRPSLSFKARKTIR